MAKSPDETLDSMVKNLKAKTGKTLEEWLKLARASKLAKHGAIVSHLKSEHGLTHGYANLVAHSLLGSAAASSSDADLIEAQYAGAKAALRPIYEKLLKEAERLGPDVEVAPKKAYVSLRRNKQFAIVQPSTATRLDLGLILKGVKPAGRLEAAGSFNAMVTHRVRLSGPSDVDAELCGWLKSAYDAC